MEDRKLSEMKVLTFPVVIDGTLVCKIMVRGREGVSLAVEMNVVGAMSNSPHDDEAVIEAIIEELDPQGGYEVFDNWPLVIEFYHYLEEPLRNLKGLGLSLRRRLRKYIVAEQKRAEREIALIFDIEEVVEEAKSLLPQVEVDEITSLAKSTGGHLRLTKDEGGQLFVVGPTRGTEEELWEVAETLAERIGAIAD